METLVRKSHHQRQPSLGKSMPMSSLIIDLNGSKNISISQDGRSPDHEAAILFPVAEEPECGDLLRVDLMNPKLAEAISKTSMLTSPAARRRLVARKMEMDANAYISGHQDDLDYVPPRDLLVYLVRMGSFNSTPKFNNEDNQDDDVEIPSGLTTTDLLHHCRMMRGDQRPQLLMRYFLNPTDRCFASQDIANGMRVLNLDDVSKICSAPVSSPRHIRILQWNVLSQSLGQKNDGFVNCPDEALTWECRKYQIVQEIVQNDPDVVCLQEVDHFKFLQMTLGSQNYEGVFFPKPDSPCLYVQSNNGPDGCAIFYKKNKFDLVNYATRILQVWRVQSNQVAIAAILRIRQTGKEICVGTTHLKARHSALLSKLRNEQGKDLLRFMSEVAGNRPIILSGDFNAEPVEPVYSTILNFVPLGLSSAYADALEEDSSLPTTDTHTDCHRSEDSFTRPELSARREPPYTTWKIREDGEVCHTIDYVFYSKDKMKVNNCLMFPQDNEIGKDRVPSFQYPSDHFSLVCDFEFQNDEAH